MESVAACAIDETSKYAYEVLRCSIESTLLANHAEPIP